MLMHSLLSRMLRASAALALVAAPVHAQTVEDGIMLAKQELLTGNLYSHDTWDEYWEGALKRTNGNIGKITTKTSVLAATYGLTDRLTVIGMVPYVWTRASQGVLHGMQGFQDVTLAAKFNVLERSSPTLGTLRAIAGVSAGMPLTDYNPELLPLSIGTSSTRVAWRVTADYHTNPGWFVTGSTAYVWRSQVELDRPYYYTNDEFVMSDRVDMPNAAEYVVSGGYMRGGLMATGFVAQQRTLGGGDIRRQDMPFVSNRMNYSRVGAMAMHPIPGLRNLEVEVGYAYTFAGRNVGQASTITTGLLYRLNGRSTR